MRGFAVLGAECSHLGDYSAEDCPVHAGDKGVRITVLLLPSRTKEGAGSFEI